MFTTLKENVAQLVCNFVDMKFPKHGHAARETQLEHGTISWYSQVWNMRSWNARREWSTHLLRRWWWTGVRLVTLNNNELRGIVSTQLPSLVVNDLHIRMSMVLPVQTLSMIDKTLVANLNWVVPGNQVQTHLMNDFILQMKGKERMRSGKWR